MSKIKVAIAGAAGYTAGELIRILLHHPNIALIEMQSNSQKGKYVHQIHTDLLGSLDAKFVEELSHDAAVIFICSGHGKAVAFLESYRPNPDQILIDLGRDFRLQETSNFINKDHQFSFVYGLPEFQKETIKKAKGIANPGCFATAIQLGLLPSIKAQSIKGEVHTTGITGSTGAGQGLSPTSHFSWRQNNISTYKTFKHQHLTEIKETLSTIGKCQSPSINFVPYRGDFTRGIYITSYWSSDESETDVIDRYQKFYENHPFTHISKEKLSLKQVVNTNNCFIHIEKIEGKIVVTSIIDNLIKGASGQATQNLNLMMGWDEKLGLNLKASNF